MLGRAIQLMSADLGRWRTIKRSGDAGGAQVRCGWDCLCGRIEEGLWNLDLIQLVSKKSRNKTGALCWRQVQRRIHVSGGGSSGGRRVGWLGRVRGDMI